jgi:hypothetical protein
MGPNALIMSMNEHGHLLFVSGLVVDALVFAMGA